MDIYTFLDQHDITYQRFDHPAVFTCEESEKLRIPMPGKDTKNLFLRDKKGKRHFLVTVGHAYAPQDCPRCARKGASACRHEKQVDLKALTDALQVQQGLSFASPERLKTYLGVEPGSVTMLGLVNDTGHAVEVVIDADVWTADAVCAHPLVNTATLVISHAGLETFLKATGHEAKIIDVPSHGSLRSP